jgi:predicted XRE-type DNA-binding protein
MPTERIRRSSGNVFADIKIPNADQYLAKAELAARILEIIRRRRLTQAEAGKILGISGRLDGFSSDRLFRFLNALGCDVQISISKPHPKTHGLVKVMAGVTP